jgi:hypothetical protein
MIAFWSKARGKTIFCRIPIGYPEPVAGGQRDHPPIAGERPTEVTEQQTSFGNLSRHLLACPGDEPLRRAEKRRRSGSRRGAQG